VRYLYGDVQTRDDLPEVLAKRVTMDRLVAEGDALVVAAERKDDGRVIGDVSLTWTSAEHQQAEIGFVFHPEVAGRGYAREAATVVLELAFDRLSVHRVFGRTDARNAASVRLMQRLGMRQEAHLRENEWFKGEWGDEVVFAILDWEWAERRAR